MNRRATATGGKRSDKGDKCGSCAALIKNGEAEIQCEICEHWWHTKCQKIGEEAFEVLQRGNAHWYCLPCNDGVGSLMAEIIKLQSKQDKYEDEINEIKSNQEEVKHNQHRVETDMGKLNEDITVHAHELVEIKEAIKEIKSSIQQQQVSQKQMESEDGLWSTIVKKHVENKIETVKEQMQEVQRTVIEAKEHIDEEKEKEKRRNNIIIYKMPEGTAASFEARRKEDLAFCQHLVQEVLEIDCKNDAIQNIIRLGKRDVTKSRPLLVTFKEPIVKSEVMEALYKLAEAEDRFKILSVSHDLTQKERDECKELVDEARQKQDQENSGEWVYRVRGYPGSMRVVRLRKRLQATGDPAID